MKQNDQKAEAMGEAEVRIMALQDEIRELKGKATYPSDQPRRIAQTGILPAAIEEPVMKRLIPIALLTALSACSDDSSNPFEVVADEPAAFADVDEVADEVESGPPVADEPVVDDPPERAPEAIDESPADEPVPEPETPPAPTPEPEPAPDPVEPETPAEPEPPVAPEPTPEPEQPEVVDEPPVEEPPVADDPLTADPALGEPATEVVLPEPYIVYSILYDSSFINADGVEITRTSFDVEIMWQEDNSDWTYVLVEADDDRELFASAEDILPASLGFSYNIPIDDFDFELLPDLRLRVCDEIGCLETEPVDLLADWS